MKVIVVMTLLFFIGCASSPDKIKTAYVSPLQYKDYNCNQVAGEMERVSRRVNELHGGLKKKANTDSAQMAVGVLLLWPTLFFLEGGDGPEAQEYARLKGENEALEKVAIQKECSVITKKEVPSDEPKDNTIAKPSSSEDKTEENTSSEISSDNNVEDSAALESSSDDKIEETISIEHIQESAALK